MQIEEGKFYQTRDGQKVGPARPTRPSEGYSAEFPWYIEGLGAVRDDGSYSPGTHDEVSQHDCVAELPIAGGSLPGFTHDRWAALVEASYVQIKSLAQKKGGEYSGDDDRLLNFRRNGAALGLPMETVWAVYAGKHWDAIQQFIKDQRNGKERERLEPIAGRVDDLLVYLLLFKAMLEESSNAG